MRPRRRLSTGPLRYGGNAALVVLLTLVAPPLARPVTAVIPRAPAAPPAQAWRVAAGPYTGMLSDGSCVSTSTGVDCAAVGSEPLGAAFGLYSSNGGATWSRSSFPKTLQGLEEVECLGLGNQVDCAAAGFPEFGAGQDSGWAAYSTNGGASWSASPAQSVPALPLGLSCAASAEGIDCVTVTDQGARYSTNGGATWSVPTQTGAPHFANRGMDSVSCVRDRAAVDCVVAGPGPVPTNGSTELLVVYHSSDGGATWSEAAVPRQTFSEYSGSVSCAPTAAAVDCAETGMYAPALYSHDGGATWSTSSGTATTGVSCTSTGKSADCTDGTNFSADGGKRWSPAEVPPDLSPYGVVCARTGSGVLCDANDQDSSVGIDYSANGGKSWSVPRMPPGYTYVGDSYLGNDWVACSASFTCATTAQGPPHGPSRASDYMLTTAKTPPALSTALASVPGAEPPP